MSEKKTLKTNKRKTARNRQVKSRYIVKNVTNIVSLIETIIQRNRFTNDIFSDLFKKIQQNANTFTEHFFNISEKKVATIENDMKKIKYNHKTDIKSTLFGFIELLNDFGIYLNSEKYKEILDIRDDFNNNLHHFIMLLNDSTYHEDTVKKFV